MTSINWKGDGRKVIRPPASALGIRPSVLRLGVARMLAKSFEETGESYHSPIGSTLWAVLDYCKSHGIPHELTIAWCESGSVMGYNVRRLSPFYS